MQSIYDILGERGPLSKTIQGFTPRKQQQQMAQSIAETLDYDDVLIAEAGTGTGKTVAYLVPVLLSGKKVIISTGTRNLQDQLFLRDLPQVREALAVPAVTALLKGRSNYLCRYRFNRLATEGRLSSDQVIQFNAIRQWLPVTRSGDISEINNIPEDSAIWPQVTSTADNCLGSDCPDYQECFVLKARKQAQQADVLVVNHHLFFADLALRDEGFGEILPGANAFVFDEAHQLADIATQFFGISISSRQLIDLASDSVTEILRDAADENRMQEKADRLQKVTREFRLLFGERENRGPWSGFENDSRIVDCLEEIYQCLVDVENLLEQHAVRGAGIERCWQRAVTLRTRLDWFISNEVPDDFEMTGVESSGEEKFHDTGYIKWFETRGKGFILHLTPLNIANTFHNYMNAREAAWIFTSATMAVGEGFDYFAANLGIDQAQMKKWDSPFNYREQGLLYIPRSMPEPSAPDFTRTVVEKALPVIKACGGRTFVLLTSYRALEEVSRLIGGRMEYPLLVQGTQPRNELLNRFRELGNAVLVGTSSFWEGVDVKGDALSCVIIDKLPFSAPDQPVLQARINSLRQQGHNPFTCYQLPEAVLTLKQGTGRLIRDINDHGVLMICDPRLLNKSYGKIFMQNIPGMPVTHDIHDVEQFFSEALA